MLTAIQIRSLKTPGRYADRDGLYLQVTKSSTKSWIYRYQLNGKRTEMGLGTLKDYTLSQAREQASEAAKLKRQGIDPKVHRDSHKHAIQSSQVWTFDKCAEAYIKAQASGWKNAKHASQWKNTLSQYASPVFGSLPVDQIDTDKVMQVLEPIWHSKTETASRVRGRIESILSWSITRQYRQGPNPALWRGHLSTLLPKRSKVQKVIHHAALPYTEIDAFMIELRKRSGLSARALELTILTATRTIEILGAKWSEFDLVDNLWVIPGERMKAGHEHRVPLSRQAVTLLEDMPHLNDWVFPGQGGKPLSNMAMLTLLQKRMGRSDLTVHGFRSTFRDWAAEVSTYPREVAEAALAHVLTNKAEAAYQRGDLLEKRSDMMQQWAEYIDYHK